MKKFLILIVLIALPVITFGQSADDNLKQDVVINKEVSLTTVADTNAMALNYYSKSEIINISYKKSNDLISIKAYRRSLQIKTKEVKSC